MTNRLDYQTLGGALSPTITFEQLIEFCRKAQDDCKELSDWAKIHESLAKAKAWATIGDNFEKIIPILSHLAKGKTKTSVGYRK